MEARPPFDCPSPSSSKNEAVSFCRLLAFFSLSRGQSF